MCRRHPFVFVFAGCFGQPCLLICQENVHIGLNAWTNLPFASFTPSPSTGKSRESIESGYSSLEKTRSDAEETQTGPDQDYRCEHLGTAATTFYFFVGFTSQLLRYPESALWDQLMVGSKVWSGFREGKIIGAMEEKGQQQVHASGSHLLRRGRGETNRTHSPGREEVYRLFGKQRR